MKHHGCLFQGLVHYISSEVLITAERYSHARVGVEGEVLPECSGAQPSVNIQSEITHHLTVNSPNYGMPLH